MSSSGDAVVFEAPGFDELADLHGEACDPELVVFMGGNEFMVVPDLLEAFASAPGGRRRVLVETLPPGVLHEQVRRGALELGTLRFAHPPDVFTAGEGRISELDREGRVAESVPYASNALALLVQAGNPSRIETVRDLARPEVRVNLPDERTEDIGRKVRQALLDGGGEALVNAVTVDKVRARTARLTRIHHRETPRDVRDGQADAGFVWRTEALHQQRLGAPLAGVALERAPRSTSIAAVLHRARHPDAARAFLAFLSGPSGRAVYARHGFDPPDRR